VKLNTAYFGINASRYDRPMGHGQFSNSSAEFFGLPLYGYNNTEGIDIYGTIAPISIDGQKGSLWHSITNTLAITAQQNINENLIIDERIYYRKTEIADDSYVYGKLSDSAFNFLPFTHSSNLTGIEIQTSYFINDQQALILGVNFENSNIERGYRGVSINSEKPLSWEFVDERISDDYQNRAFYGQYQFETNILNSTIFTLGIRRDQNNIYGDTTNPRVGIVNQVTEKLTLKALYGSAFRAPNSFDTFSKTTTRIPNPKPELMHNLEFSAGYQFNDDFYLETNFFSNKLTDTIISNVDIGDIDGNGANNTQNQNLGDAKIKGIEFKTLFTLSNDLSGFSAISYQSPKQEFEGMSDDIPNVTDIKVNFGLVWQYDDKSSIYMITRYVGERTTAKTNPRNEVDSYLVMDLHLLKQNIFESNITMSLKINNLFNSSIADPGVRSADGLSFSTQHTYPGQNVILKISYHY
jgi:outer membrane receptor for ferrienterochelin and colicin